MPPTTSRQGLANKSLSAIAASPSAHRSVGTALDLSSDPNRPRSPGTERASVTPVLWIESYPAILTVLVLSLVLGAHLQWVNWCELQRQRRKQRGGSVPARKRISAQIAQVVATALYMANQTTFLLQATVSAGRLGAPDTVGCAALLAVGDASYFIFQTLATTVLILRTTLLVPEGAFNLLRSRPQERESCWKRVGDVLRPTRTKVRAVLFIEYACALLLLVYAAAVKHVEVDSPWGPCNGAYHRPTNTAGEFMLVVVYAGILATFALPLARHVVGMRKWSMRRQSPVVGLQQHDQEHARQGALSASSFSNGPIPTTPTVALPSITQHAPQSSTPLVGQAPSLRPPTPVPGRRVSIGEPPRHQPLAPPIPPPQPTVVPLPASTQRLQAVLTAVSMRISLAVLAYLIAAIIAVAGGWGGSFIVEFTFQNYCSLFASTFATQDPAMRRRAERSDEGGSSTGPATAVAALSQEARRLRAWWAQWPWPGRRRQNGRAAGAERISTPVADVPEGVAGAGGRGMAGAPGPHRGGGLTREDSVLDAGIAGATRATVPVSSMTATVALSNAPTVPWFEDESILHLPPIADTPGEATATPAAVYTPVPSVAVLDGDLGEPGGGPPRHDLTGGSVLSPTPRLAAATPLIPPRS